MRASGGYLKTLADELAADRITETRSDRLIATARMAELYDGESRQGETGLIPASSR